MKTAYQKANYRENHEVQLAHEKCKYLEIVEIKKDYQKMKYQSNPQIKEQYKNRYPENPVLDIQVLEISRKKM